MPSSQTTYTEILRVFLDLFTCVNFPAHHNILDFTNLELTRHRGMYIGGSPHEGRDILGVKFSYKERSTIIFVDSINHAPECICRPYLHGSWTNV